MPALSDTTLIDRCLPLIIVARFSEDKQSRRFLSLSQTYADKWSLPSLPRSPVPASCASKVQTLLAQAAQKPPLLRSSQVIDSMCPEFPVLDAHKELFVGTFGRQGRDAGVDHAGPPRLQPHLRGRRGTVYRLADASAKKPIGAALVCPCAEAAD